MRPIDLAFVVSNHARMTENWRKAAMVTGGIIVVGILAHTIIETLAEREEQATQLQAA